MDWVKLLIHAVRRLEDGYEPESTSPPSQCHHPPQRPLEMKELELDTLTHLVGIMLRPPKMLVVDKYNDSSNCFNLLFVSFFASLSIYTGVNTNRTLTYS